MSASSRCAGSEVLTCLSKTNNLLILLVSCWCLLHHDVSCKRLLRIVGEVKEVDVLELADVEVGPEFTSPLWECWRCTIKDGRCRKSWLWEVEHVACSILDVDVVEVEASGQDVSILTDVFTRCTLVMVVVVVVL